MKFRVVVATALANTVLASVSRRQVQSSNLPYDVPGSLQNILDNTHGSDLYTYPTDLTRGIIPKSTVLHDISSSLTKVTS